MKVAASVLSVVVVGINIYFVIDFVKTNLPAVWWVDLLLAIYGILYVGFIAYLTTLLYGVFDGPGFERIRERVVYNNSTEQHDWDDPEVNELPSGALPSTSM